MLAVNANQLGAWSPEMDMVQMSRADANKTCCGQTP